MQGGKIVGAQIRTGCNYIESLLGIEILTDFGRCGYFAQVATILNPY